MKKTKTFRKYLKEGVLPQNVVEWNDKDIVDAIEQAVKLSVPKLKKNQEIIKKQQSELYKELTDKHGDSWMQKGNEDMRHNGQLISHIFNNFEIKSEIYATARNIKEFKDSKPEEYVSLIKQMIKK